MQISGLFIYPIKGCRGVAIDRGNVDRLGLIGDRRLMLVDEHDRFISQREVPELATLQPVLNGTQLQVRGPTGDSLDLAIDDAGRRRVVSLWASAAIPAFDQGDDAAAWFSETLGTPCRVVHFGEASRREIDPRYSPRAGAQTAFTDGYPILATLQESLDDLNSRLAEPVPMARFRPSVVVAGAPAWNEDDWTAVRFGDLACDAVKPCARCVVTTTDQQSGARDPLQEPLRTLAGFRNHPGLGAIFGQNIVPRDVGTLAVGDAVTRA